MPAPSRRNFLTAAAVTGLAANAGARPAKDDARAGAPDKSIPAVTFGKKTISRVILGGNPIDGYSHSVPKLSDLMREYFTVARTADLILHAEEEGITAFESHYSEKVAAAITLSRERGGKMQWICLTHAGEERFLNDIVALKPIAIAHHGNRTDTFFQNDNADRVHDFVKKIHDLGFFAGVSTHCPKHVAIIEDSGWENDFYMTCMYYLTRTPAELKLMYGDTLVNKSEEPFVKGDPERMSKQILAAKKPCLAFKILAAGRNCGSNEAIEECFRFAYSHVKSTDAIIVGMYPALMDEVRIDAELARKHGAPVLLA